MVINLQQTKERAGSLAAYGDITGGRRRLHEISQLYAIISYSTLFFLLIRFFNIATRTQTGNTPPRRKVHLSIIVREQMGGAVDVCVGKICPPAAQMANSTQRAAVRERERTKIVTLELKGTVRGIWATTARATVRQPKDLNCDAAGCSPAPLFNLISINRHSLGFPR